MRVRIFQLAFQYSSRGITVGCSLFKAVIFFHGLIVQILTVNHKQHLIDIGQFRSKPCSFKRSERLAGASRVPNISTAFHTSIFLIIICDLNTVQNTLRCRDLVWTHNHQHIFRSKNTVFCEDIQNRMLCKKRLSKINQIRDHTIVGVRPEAGKFKAVACPRLACSSFLMFLFRISSGTIGIILRICSIRNDKNLNILIQSTPCPKRLSLIAVNLVKCLTNSNTSSFQFNMHERQTINQNGHIIAIVVLCAVLFADRILIDNLQSVIMDVCFINQCNILGFPTITL